jgi:hypothetical protein
MVASIISSFARQNEGLIKQMNQLMYYYRGSLQRDDAWALSHVEREYMIEFLNDRFKEAGDLMKKQIPVFL